MVWSREELPEIWWVLGMRREERFRSKPGVNALVGMGTSKLRSLELKLGLIQTVVLSGIIMGAMLCAFAFGYLSGESVGFERALASSVANVTRFPVVEEGHTKDAGRDRAAQIYAKLGDAKSAAAGSLGDSELELGKIPTTLEEPVAQSIPAASVSKEAGVNAAAEGSKNPVSGAQAFDLNVLDRPTDEELGRAAGGVSVLGDSPGGGGAKTLGALLSDGDPLESAAERVLPPGQPAASGPRQETAPKPQFADSVVSKPVPSTVKQDPQQEPILGDVPLKSTLSAGWYAQVAAPQKLEDANRLAAKLRASGFPVVVEKTQVRGQQYFRVLTGPEKGRNQAEQLVGQLKREKYLGADPFIRMVK